MDSSVGLIEVPAQLLEAIDNFVGAEHRSEFARSAMEAELRRRRMLDYVRNGEPAWKDEDHSELAQGSYASVRRLRDESDQNMQALEAHRDAK